jgi:hypothetical protein
MFVAMVRGIATPAVAVLGAVVALLCAGVLNTEQAFAGFASPAACSGMQGEEPNRDRARREGFALGRRAVETPARRSRDEQPPTLRFEASGKPKQKRGLKSK